MAANKLSTFQTFRGTDADAVFAYQAFVGLCYKMAENMSLGLEYRYFAADDAAWDFGISGLKLNLGGVQTHSLSLAFSWHF